MILPLIPLALILSDLPYLFFPFFVVIIFCVDRSAHLFAGHMKWFSIIAGSNVFYYLRVIYIYIYIWEEVDIAIIADSLLMKVFCLIMF